MNFYAISVKLGGSMKRGKGVSCSCGNTVLHERRIINGSRIYECKRCGLLVTELPDSYNLIESNKDYYSYNYLNNYIVRGFYLKKRFLTRIMEIKGYKKLGGNLLDVGCSTGLFLKVARENLRHKWRLFGIDMNKKAIDIAKASVNAKFYYTSLLGSTFKSNFFDCITCFDVLEHDWNIKENLQVIRRILKKNGLLVIQLPNHRSFMAYICGNNWDWWSVPDHVLHFSPHVLSEILLDNGFVIKKLFTWEPAKEFVENVRGSIKKTVTKFVGLNRILAKASVVPLYLLWGILRIVEKKFTIGGLTVVYAVKR